MEDTTKLCRKLEKILNSDQEDPELIIRYMKRLSDIEMTLGILTKTGIGIIINKFRKKCRDQAVTSSAMQLIKQWKKLVPKTEAGGSGGKRRSDEGEDSGSSGDERKRVRLDADDESSSQSGASVQPAPPQRRLQPSQKPTLARNQETTDQFRLKGREMILKALTKEEVPEGSYDPEYLSVQIETAIYNSFLNTEKDYKQRVRTRVMNLRDHNNPELRLNVLSGSFSAEKLATCTSEEMASKEMQQLRATYMREIISESQLATGGGSESSLLKCPRCRKSKCSYNQVQTRSADEPMTTFAFCNECGHRWKFC